MDSIALEKRYSASNYHPLPVVLSRGEGVFLYDVEERRYYDFLSAYSAVSQGHSHPAIIEALTQQARRLALTSRAFHSDVLGSFSAYITDYFGYEKVLMMNTGVEAVETAIKLCRKWGYEKKGIAEGQAKIVVCEGNFHGRTMTAISLSTDTDSRRHYGPYLPGIEVIPYDDVPALEKALADTDVAGFLVESLQGEAGVLVPSEDYIREVRRCCTAAEVLFVADEIQAGLARTGSMLGVCGSCACEGRCQRTETYVRPDVLLLGKALSGGVYPVSAVLADSEYMDVFTPNTHGSTYGGNPLACRVAEAALEVIRKEGLMERARALGARFRLRMQRLVNATPMLSQIRGRGLLNALVIAKGYGEDTAWRLCLALKARGLLAKPTHGDKIRLAPPLVITEAQLDTCCEIIEQTVHAFEAVPSMHS